MDIDRVIFILHIDDAMIYINSLKVVLFRTERGLETRVKFCRSENGMISFIYAFLKYSL